MNAGEIRQAANMYALVAEIESVKVTAEAMKAENLERSSRGESPAWAHEAFDERAKALSEIASRLRREI